MGMEDELKDINQKVFNGGGNQGNLDNGGGSRPGGLSKKVNFANIASDNLLR